MEKIERGREQTVAAVLSLTLGWLILIFAFTAPLVQAHGEHGEATPVLGEMSLFSFNGFQVELLGSPRPLRVGTENRIIAKIFREGSIEPVRNGKVYMGILPRPFANRPDVSDQVSNANPARVEIPLSPAPELIWAGSYTFTHRFREKGTHLARVAIAELGGRTFNPPAVFDFYLNVDPAPGFTGAFLLVAITAVFIALGAVYWGVVRFRSPARSDVAFDLLEIPWLRRFVTWKGFQPLLQIPVLVLIVAIAFLGFFDVQDGAKNLATKLTWILWWPGIIFTFILVGRLWCVVCPFGALNEWAANLCKPTRLFPKSLRSLWLATFLFLLLTWADEQIGVIRSPQLTAWLIVAFAVFATVTGLLFQRRSFCHYLCPITGLLGLYSMVSPVEVRAGDRSQCQKNCHQDCYRGNEKGNGCPMFEFPMTVERNTFCNLCFECVKSCPNRNLALRFRSFGKDLWASSKHLLDESYLSVLMVGVTTIVTAQMLTGWSGFVSILSRIIPPPVRSIMRPVTYLTLTETAAFFLSALVFFPALAWLAAWAASRLSGDNQHSAKQTFMHFAFMFLPVGLAMHLAHNVSHLIAEGPGVIPAFERTLTRYTPFNGGSLDWRLVPLVSSDAIHWLQILLVLGGFIFSLIVAFRLAAVFFDRKDRAGQAIVPLVVLSLLFTLINIYLLNQPMGARHGM